MSSWLRIEQPRLGCAGVMFLLVFTALVTPLSLDMYTPAIPQMSTYFATDNATVNLTLVGFYVMFAVGQLLMGPVSDRWGRRVVYLAGGVVYAAGSALCAIAGSIILLIAMRVVQALGAGALAATSMALVKDAFVPERRGTVLSVAQAIFAVGPILAPVLGAVVIEAFDWRVTFWLLALFGLTCVALGLLMEETLPPQERRRAGDAGVASSLVRTLRDPAFTLFLTVSALFSLPFMAYVSVASYVYVDQFGLSELQYGLYFGFAMAAMVVGPLLCLALLRVMSARRFTSGLLVCGLAVGVVLLLFGATSASAFCGIFTVYVLIESCVRPCSANILLAQPGHDAGAASSLINFSHTALGTVGMLVAVLPWATYLEGLGIVMVATMVVAMVLWLALLRGRAPLADINE